MGMLSGVLNTGIAAVKPRTDLDTRIDAFDDYLDMVGIHDPKLRQEMLQKFEEKEIAKASQTPEAQ